MTDNTTKKSIKIILLKTPLLDSCFTDSTYSYIFLYAVILLDVEK